MSKTFKPFIQYAPRKPTKFERYSAKPFTRAQIQKEARLQRTYNRNLRKVKTLANRNYGRTSFGIVTFIFVVLLAFSVFYALSPTDKGEIMYTQTFLEMIRDAPVLNMSWANFRDDWLANWDANYLPGLRTFVGGLVGILQVVAVICGGIGQLCMYVFHFLQWIF